jgi:hypothetical protein
MKSKALRQSFPFDVTSPGPTQLLSPRPGNDPYDLPDEVVTGITYGELRRLHSLADPEARWRERAGQAKSAERIIGVTFTSAEEVAARVGDAPKRLINCVLAGLDLHSIDLSFFVFDACDLSQSRLGVCNHAEFYSSNLRKAVLTGVDFRWVKTLNCRFDGADLLGMQVTVDCNLRTGMATDLNHDAYLMLYWLALGENPLLTKVRDMHIPNRVRASLDATFRREP